MITKDEARDEAKAAWRNGFQRGWEASGEGFNGEYPDEGIEWIKSAGYQAMMRIASMTALESVPVPTTTAVIAEVERLAKLDLKCPCCTGYQSILEVLAQSPTDAIEGGV